MARKSSDPITIYAGAWLQNCKNIQGPNQKYSFWIRKWRRFLDSCSSPSSSVTFSVVKAIQALAVEPQSGSTSHGCYPCHHDTRWPLPSFCNKSMHPLAIKARGETGRGKKKMRADRGEKERIVEDYRRERRREWWGMFWKGRERAETR